MINMIDMFQFCMDTSDVDSGGWTIVNFINAFADFLEKMASYIYTILGFIMLIVGIFKIARALQSNGRAQTSWIINILCVVLGAAFAFGGVYGILTELGHAAKGELEYIVNKSDTNKSDTPAESSPAPVTAIIIDIDGLHFE